MNSYGLVFGGEKTSHDSGNDIAYNVVSGNDYTKVVIEGDEYILPKEAMQSEKVYDFEDKLPIEMLDEIKRSENVFIRFPNLRQGDMVVCKNSVRNDDLHTIKGTAKEIANYLQGLSACRIYAKGGYISGELANGGGVEDESQLRLLTPMPPTKLGKTGIDSLTEIIGKDERRPALSGALYAGKGRIVATDANILVVLENQNYPKSLEGTIKSLWNKVPQERLVGISYPNWEAVVPNQQNFQTKELSIDDVLAYAYGGFLEGKNIIKEKDFNKYQKEKFKYVLRLNIGNIEIGVDSLLLTRILRTLKANDVRKIVFHIGQTNQRPIKITTDNKHYGLIMPVMIADKVEDLGEAIYVSQQIFYPISDKDFRAMSKKYGEYLTEFSKMVGGERMAEGGEITMNVPLLLRVLELAKEEVKEDKELHFIAERLQTLSKKGTLTMEDYDYISGLESNDKIQKLIAENDSNDSNLRFEQGGEIKKKSELLAPNGKPSNLTPEQWHLVRTPEFKAWFGDWEALENAKTRDKGMDEVTLKNLASNVSKVVDENGEPLVVWHFAKRLQYELDKFYTFNVDKQLGSHFGTLNQAKNLKYLISGGDGVLKPTKDIADFRYYQVFLNIKNPIRLKDVGIFEEESILEQIEKTIRPIKEYELEYFNNRDTKETRLNKIKDWLLKNFQIDGVVYLNRYETNAPMSLINSLDDASDESFKSKIKDAEDSWIAFYPNQIKLAYGSNTTFDSNNPDIRFEKGGGIKKKSELLAPNGKPSNLTLEQWHLVRTPEFKAWFGDWENSPETASKVVDSNGEPLVVYRGSKTKNPNYIPHTHISGGIFFSTNKEVAKLYIESVWQNWIGRVFDCFLNIKKIENFNALNFKTNIYQGDFKFYDSLVLKSKQKFNGLKWENIIDLPNLDIIYPKEPTDFIATTYVVFEPNQIKLADGTNTTFDSNNPDIRFEKGGGVEDEINPEQIRTEIEALEEVLQVLEGENRQLIQDEIEILKLALGELEYTKLLAPNGKPSNLTPEQWNLVRTPEFKAWFGDWENSPKTASKVVDENGEPLVVFREIKATEKNYFNTEVENFAISQRWQTNLDEILTRKLPSETKVGDEVSGFNKRGVVTEINNGIFKIKYEDGSVFSGNAFGLTFYGEKKPKKVISAFLNIRILGGNEKLFVHSFGVQKDSGILSISADYKTYFTFRSNQVKLADGSNTNFDANNPDIRFEKGGGIKKKSELLAPNGKPSNLTPEQWHLVRTPEFKAWFGDWENYPENASKVVDKNGEPLVLYRGNEGQMGKYGFEFKLGLNLLNKPNKNDFGFFFTDDLEVAKKYRKVDLYDSYIAGSITPIFLKAVKVLDLSDFGVKVWQERFVVGLEKKGIKFDSFEHLPNKIINFDEGVSYEDWGNNTYDYFDVFPELRDLFLANGYEAVLFKEISRHYFPYNVFVAFHSNQIKLADGSNTKFDSKNPDIRFEKGGGFSYL
jgi:hypothetical protein